MTAVVDKATWVDRDGKAYPKKGSPRPAAVGATPRQVEPLERVPETLAGKVKRFKATMRNSLGQNHEPPRYILAKSEQEAREFFEKQINLDEIKKMVVGEPLVVVRELPD